MLQFLKILLLFAPFISFAQQPGFKKTYRGELTAASFMDVVWDGQKLITTGQFLTDTAPYNALNGLLYMELDTHGNTLFTDVYFHPNDAVASNIGNSLAAIDGHVFAPTQMYNQTEENLLVTYQQSQRIAEKIIHVEGLRTWLLNMAPYQNAYLLSGGSQNFSYNAEGMLIKSDALGNEMWRKYYGTPDVDVYTAEPYVIDNNTILLPINRRYWPSQTMVQDNWTQTQMLIVDSLGNVKSTWESPLTKEQGPDTRVCKLANGHWIYTTSEYIKNPGPLDKWGNRPKIVCRDTAFNLVWQRYLPSAVPLPVCYTIDLQPTSDGNFIAAGKWSETEWSGASVIMKIAPNGDLIWTYRDYCTPLFGCNQNLGGVVELPSGSVVAAGYSENFEENWTYGVLLKVDKNGCMDTLCSQSIGQAGNTYDLDKLAAIRVFPNPVSAFLTVTNPIGEHIDLLDLNGRVIRSVMVSDEIQTIPMSDIPPGAYVVRMQEKTLRVSYKIIKI